MQGLLKLKNSITGRFVMGLALILAISALFCLALFLFLHASLPDKNTFMTTLCILTAAFLAALAAIAAYIYLKAAKPLSVGEKMVYEVYNEILKSKGSAPAATNVSLQEVIETVIVQQRDSWHRELTANLLRQKAELAQLQSQINPHFLYNTLDSIRGLALMKKVPEIAQMTAALSLLFRNNTRKTGMLVPLDDEIKCIENYILIQQFRFRDKFIFEKQIDSADDILQCRIPNFIIQPIIENAIYHGLETVPSKGKILLYAYKTQSRLVIQVTDNGCGIPHSKLEELLRDINHGSAYDPSETVRDMHTGIGLANINQRIKMQFGDQYGLTIASTENIGTQVEITLPYGQ